MSRVSAREVLERFVRWAIVDEGSTRGLGLIRVGAALMLWARFGDLIWFHADAGPGELLHVAAFYVSTLLLLIGLVTPLSASVAAIATAYGYFFLGWSNHHIQLLLLTTTILAISPCGRSYSVDRWLALRGAARRGEPPPEERAPLWGARLLTVLICSLYLATCYDKTTLAWLRGERISAILCNVYVGSRMLDSPLFERFMMLVGVGVWALEGALSFGLYVPCLRRVLVPLGTLLHLSFYAMFRVYTFSTNMLLLYVPFYSQDELARGIDRLCPRDATADVTRRVVARPRFVARAAGMAFAFVVIVYASARDLTGSRTPRSGPALELMAGRWSGVLPAAREGKRARSQQIRREMQDWVPARKKSKSKARNKRDKPNKPNKPRPRAHARGA